MRNDTIRTVKTIVILASAIVLISGLACKSTKQPTANKAAETQQPAPQPAAPPSPFDVKESAVIAKTSPFDHTRPEHQTKTKDCGFCHQRPDNNVTPVFPGHSACIECHAKDFTNTASQMCVVCHKSPVDAQGTRISFPAKMSEFGVKGFSHRQHMDAKKMAGETEGFVKIVADKKYDEILGVHMIGPRSTELVAEAVLALRLECTVEELVKTIHAHPTFSEAIGEAAHATHGAPIHL